MFLNVSRRTQINIAQRAEALVSDDYASYPCKRRCAGVIPLHTTVCRGTVITTIRNACAALVLVLWQ